MNGHEGRADLSSSQHPYSSAPARRVSRAVLPPVQLCAPTSHTYLNKNEDFSAPSSGSSQHTKNEVFFSLHILVHPRPANSKSSS